MSSDTSLGQILSLLKEKNNTSRFVALALIRSWIDTNHDSQKNIPTLLQIWRAIPKSFLLRLLKAQPPKSKEDDSRSMNSLAVAVIHTFANLLPAEQLENENFAVFCDSLIDALSRVDSTHKALILQSFQCIVSTKPGCHAFLVPVINFEHLWKAVCDSDEEIRQTLKLIRIVHVAGDLSSSEKQQLGLVVQFLLGNAKSSLDLVFPTLSEIVDSNPADLQQAESWIWPAIAEMKIQLLKNPKKSLRDACIIFAGTLLRNLPSTANLPHLLFARSSDAKSNPDQNFGQLFIKLILVDIRSTIPILMTTLTTPSYPTTAYRLALCYDLVSAFLSVLLSISTEEDETSSSLTIFTNPDQLLTLRNDLNEAFSLTMEYFRDRWDASVAGAAGLHESARAPNQSSSHAPLPLTWDNPDLPLKKDPILLSGLRALAVWLREDENESLSNQALGILDMMLELYSSEGDIDFRSSILTALHGILPTSTTAVQDFLDQNGWQILSSDFITTFKTQQSSPHLHELIRVLLDVVESDAVHQSKEAWMKNIEITTEQAISFDPSALENIIAAYQLDIAIYEKAPRKLQQSHANHIKKLRNNVVSILKRLERNSGSDQELIGDANDVLEGLQSLRLD